ncbi:oxidoreductase [Vibrio methylphosphonaticus]|uniref:oxidoreductase n=1 Tax=Vibrio methylphosphonaticus TaxID=2946866 RepID=UPI002029D0E0|nr:oxidoreductase [Vibrio methylphosphonaticus]MCL9777471.1 oxidoreductase [Vibrio methylphosphonaticus]
MDFAPIKTAVIGYGFSAKTFHLPFISSMAEFELCAISSSQAESVKNDWPAVDHYQTADDLLNHSDAELVIITAPNDVHFSLAKTALENNKHVIIEKPFVTQVEDGETLVALANKQQRVLSVYHNRRWDGDFLTVKKLIEEGNVGDVKHFESHFDRFRPEVRQRWREQTTNGGGILFDLGSHLIDQCLDLFGLPDAITAQCLMLREGSSNVDYFNVTLHYPNHIALLHGDLFSAAPNQRFSLKGTQGSYEKMGLDPQEARLIAGVSPTEPNWTKEAPEHYGNLYRAEAINPVTTEPGNYQHYFEKMAEAIRKNSRPPVEASDAIWTIKLIELAMESSRQGKTLVIEK